jgi:hypothetical protein
MKVGPPEACLVFCLKGDCAAVVAVAVLRVREHAFFVALENVGNTAGARYFDWICSKCANLQTQKQAVIF